MPVIPEAADERTWLDPGPEDRDDPCRPCPDDDLDASPVPRAVNDPSNDRASIIQPDEKERTGLGSFTQRLGRILRPKENGGRAILYELVSEETAEENVAERRR